MNDTCTEREFLARRVVILETVVQELMNLLSAHNPAMDEQLGLLGDSAYTAAPKIQDGIKLRSDFRFADGRLQEYQVPVGGNWHEGS